MYRKSLTQAEQNKLVMAGALTEPVDGAIFIFRNASPQEIEEFVKADPYVVNGLVPEYKIRPYMVRIYQKCIQLTKGVGSTLLFFFRCHAGGGGRQGLRYEKLIRTTHSNAVIDEIINYFIK